MSNQLETYSVKVAGLTTSMDALDNMGKKITPSNLADCQLGGMDQSTLGGVFVWILQKSRKFKVEIMWCQRIVTFIQAQHTVDIRSLNTPVKMEGFYDVKK